MYRLPFDLVKFWYVEAPLSLISFFGIVNKQFLTLFSLPLMLKTFFRPWKNEYREGLVGFSIFMGIAFKTLFILIDLVILAFLIVSEAILFVWFLAFPAVIVYLFLIKL
ncbi:MAG: hypothetical protein HY344_00465 [Candidatus Levybacteria bacterium]|nr:hypothetical protein [Candidatus Levybacteria bacterium]